MTDQAEPTFEGFAILELMGHRRLAGVVSEATIAGQGFIRLDIPAVESDGEELPAATQFYAPAAVYAITPSTEETVKLIRERPQPVHPFEIRTLSSTPRPTLASVAARDDQDDDEEVGF